MPRGWRALADRARAVAPALDGAFCLARQGSMMERLFSPDGFDETGAGPLYLQLQRRIADAIAAGRLAPGDSLPPERDMAAMTGL